VTNCGVGEIGRRWCLESILDEILTYRLSAVLVAVVLLRAAVALEPPSDPSSSSFLSSSPDPAIVPITKRIARPPPMNFHMMITVPWVAGSRLSFRESGALPRRIHRSGPSNRGCRPNPHFPSNPDGRTTRIHVGISDGGQTQWGTVVQRYPRWLGSTEAGAILGWTLTRLGAKGRIPATRRGRRRWLRRDWHTRL